MSKTLFTLTGARHYYGADLLAPGMKLRLVKEPDNPVDREAIRVEVKGLGKIGYVANSVYTVLGESLSAGRLYDRIDDTAKAKVLYVLPGGAICKVCKKSLIGPWLITCLPDDGLADEDAAGDTDGAIFTAE